MAAETRAMARVLIYMNISPREVDVLLTDEWYSTFSDLEARLGEGTLKNFAPKDISLQARDTLAQIVVFVKHHPDVTEPKSFIKASTLNFMDQMWEYLDSQTCPMNRSLRAFLQETLVSPAEVYALNVFHGVYDYHTLKAMEYSFLHNSTLIKGVSAASCVLLGMILQTLPHVEMLNYLQDPLSGFRYKAFLELELHNFCYKLHMPTRDIAIIISGIGHCTYENLVRNTANFFNQYGGFGTMCKFQRHMFARALHYMREGMHRTNPLLRMRKFNFAVLVPKQRRCKRRSRSE